MDDGALREHGFDFFENGMVFYCHEEVDGFSEKEVWTIVPYSEIWKIENNLDQGILLISMARGTLEIPATQEVRDYICNWICEHIKRYYEPKKQEK